MASVEMAAAAALVVAVDVAVGAGRGEGTIGFVVGKIIIGRVGSTGVGVGCAIGVIVGRALGDGEDGSKDGVNVGEDALLGESVLLVGCDGTVDGTSVGAGQVGMQVGI